MPASSLPSSPFSVAVGHGWLSDALNNHNSPYILGTLCSDGIYPDSIEVILLLKEVPFSTLRLHHSLLLTSTL